MKSILCTICARAGSKGVKNKNIRELHGKPLIAYTIEQAKAANIFDHIVVSTDSDQIAEAATRYGAEVFFKREPEMASDTAGKLQVIQDAFVKSEKYYNKKFDYLVDLDATSPLRNVDDILNAFQVLLNGDFDNVITAAPSRRSPYFNMVEVNDDSTIRLSKSFESNVIRRQDAPKAFDMNASIYVWNREAILNTDSVISNKTGLYVMPEERSLDIDSELDFAIVKFLMEDK